MRVRPFYLWYGVIPLLASCASQPIALGPVGPPPWADVTFPATNGRLEVFSEIREYDEDDAYYFPHSPYTIYTADGKRVRYVWNHHNHEDENPTVVKLPAGEYVIKADATLYGPVSVPVVIKPGQTTRVVLQPGWKPSGEYAASDLVRMPNGYPIGWRAKAVAKD